MLSNQKQDKLSEIVVILAEIRDILKAYKPYDDTNDKDPIIVHSSRATCPECESQQVNLGTLGDKHPVYQCRDCQRIWVNSEEALSE